MIKKIYKYVEKYLIFFLLFNIGFGAFLLSLKYALPFVLSILVTVWLYPLTELIFKKTKINKNIINILCIIASFAVIVGGISLIGYGMYQEIKDLVVNTSIMKIDVNSILSSVDYAKEHIKLLHPDVLNLIISQVETLANTLGNLGTSTINETIKILTSIPTVIVMLIITIMSTFFLLKDFEKIKDKFLNLKINQKTDVPVLLLNKANKIVIKYIQSYSLLISLTFIETLLIFKFLGINYSFSLAIICAIADVVPIVGIGFIFIPLSAIYFILGNVSFGIVTMVLFIIISVIRQIIEPKILSSSLKIHPVTILMCIYIGMNIYGVMGILYLMFLVIFSKILKEIDML